MTASHVATECRSMPRSGRFAVLAHLSRQKSTSPLVLVAGAGPAMLENAARITTVRGQRSVYNEPNCAATLFPRP